MADFNINLLNCNAGNDASDYIDTFYSHSIYPAVNTPTRIAPTTKVLIENAFFNNTSNNIISGNIATSISNRLTQILLVLGQLTGVQPHKAKDKRSFHNFEPKAFEKDIENIVWNKIFQNLSFQDNLTY